MVFSGNNANLHQILSFLHQIWRFIFVSEFASFIVQFWIKYIHSQFLFISASFFCKSESNFNSWFFIQKLCKSASFIFQICINFDDSIFSLNLHHLFCKSESNNSMTIFFSFLHLFYANLHQLFFLNASNIMSCISWAGPRLSLGPAQLIQTIQTIFDVKLNEIRCSFASDLN